MFNVKMIAYPLVVLMIGFFSVQANASDVDVMNEEGAISGVVVDAATEYPVSGVEVTLEMSDETAETNADGEFSIENLEEGTYTLVVEAEGYETWSQTIEVNNEETEVEIRLQPAE